MGISDISLAAGMYKNLLALKDTSVKIDRTQERLSSGKKVNSALDNPTNYFASQAALNRASDLSDRKDGMSEAIRNGDAANAGLKAITSLIESAKGIANSAHSASVGDRASLAAQFNVMLAQIDSLAGDSGYRGTNLLKDDNLTINFNENGSSNLTITGVDATSAALGIVKTDSAGNQQGNAIAAGGNFSVALKFDGSVVAWGFNGFGATTVPVAAQSGVVSISSGMNYSLALKNDGSVVAWGDNSLGQATVPAAAQSGVTSVAAGSNFSLALKNDGSVVAWGDNSVGQTTVPLAASSNVISIAAGAAHALALKSDGSVVAWGDNFLGRATVPAAAQSGVVAISAGLYQSLALKSDGSVIAWGGNSAGEATVPVAAQSGVVAISAGWQFSLALKSDGSVVAWGDNSSGESTVPAAAQSGVIAISTSPTAPFALALKSDGSVIGWGDNNVGETTIPPAAQSGVMIPSAWLSDAGITKSENQLESAMNTLRVNSAALSSSLSVVAVRQDFTQQMISTLQTGSDNLTLADMNQEGANMLMLQTRQSLGVTSLSMASQASQSVMKLFS